TAARKNLSANGSSRGAWPLPAYSSLGGARSPQTPQVLGGARSPQTPQVLGGARSPQTPQAEAAPKWHVPVRSKGHARAAVTVNWPRGSDRLTIRGIHEEPGVRSCTRDADRRRCAVPLARVQPRAERRGAPARAAQRGADA